MSHIKRYIFTVLAAIIFIAGINMPGVAFAEQPSETVVISDKQTRSQAFIGSLVLNQDYQTLYSKSVGINNNVTIQAYDVNSMHHVDIRMLDRNGNIVWEEYGAVDYNETRTFWCGSDVASIQARVASETVFGEMFQERGMCDVWVG